jgi:molecular chaperone GrpE (heat shock protein)
MSNLASDSDDLIQQLLPALDELLALMEYYDNATYIAAVTHMAKVLADKGLVAFDDKNLYLDPTRHDIHQTFGEEGCEQAYVRKTHIRGYSINGQIIRKSIVDVTIPFDA